MRKKSTRKSSAASLLASPLPPPSATAAGTRSPTVSPASPAVKFDFNLNGFADIASALKKKSNKNGGATIAENCVNTISDLKDLASSNLDSVKHQLEGSHYEILKDIEASQSRPQKRFKHVICTSLAFANECVGPSSCQLPEAHFTVLVSHIQTQACQQVMEEAEKEYKKMSDRINEGREAMKASYAEFMEEAQATASRFCKTSISELAKTTEKGIASLQSLFGISSTAA
ncbi:hypothetical protein OROGR_026935 [Orobanche gracilis]